MTCVLRVDWHFCVVGFESSAFRDPDCKRTYLFDGRQPRTFAELSGGAKMELLRVHGGSGFIPAGHKMLRQCGRVASPIVIVASPYGKHLAALAFRRAIRSTATRASTPTRTLGSWSPAK